MSAGDPEAPTPLRGSLFRKYLVSFVALVSAALVANSLLDAMFSYREQKSLLIVAQREQANAAAAKIDQFLGEIERQLGWLSQLSQGTVSVEERRITAIRLLRLTPSIGEVAQLDANGREQLRVSRFVKDTIASGADYSQAPAFLAAKAHGTGFGPVFFFRETEPYVTIGVTGSDRSIILADVNLRFMWDLVTQIKVGKGGKAFVVDSEGRLIAHPDLRLVLQNTGLSRLPQVAAALSPGANAPDERVVKDLAGRSVLSVDAPVRPTGWRVFVELPTDEAYASIYRSTVNSLLLLLTSLGCAFVAAMLLSRRMAVPIRALTQGAARIGSGDLDQRLDIRTGDELEALGEEFNRTAGRLRESYATLERKVVERTAELAQTRDQALEERELAQRARQAAERANETKARFLAAVSHELRTPLNGVIGVLQLLDNGRLGETQRRQLDIARTSGDTLLALIDSILEYARLEAGSETLEPRNFRIDQLVEAAVELMRPEAEAKKLSLDIEIGGDTAALVHGDPVRLNRVLLNLLGNAIKFTGHGGVRLVAAFEGPGAVGTLGIAITDTGIGIAPDMQERIFADFVQADDSIARRFGGTGLGLAISRRLARLMGGDLTVESSPGAGSTFRLIVPLTRAAEASPSVEAIVPHDALAVLLVDDDPVNREVGEALLRLLGHEPTIAADGPTAVELAATQAFDAVLMDLHMPGMDGIAAARRIRDIRTARPPRVIALTADVSDEVRERVARNGIDIIVSKPIMLTALRAALQIRGGAPAGTAVPAASGPIDLIDDVYFAVQRSLLGVPRLRTLRTLFAETSASLLRTIGEAADADDADAVQRALHQLGGSASALALAELSARCAAFEGRNAAGAFRAVADELDALRQTSLAALDERLRETETAS